MEEIINALLDVVREQQRSGISPEAAMSRSDVVNMALKMMEQNGTEIEQETVTDTWRAVLRMAPKLFGSDMSDVPPAALHPSEQIARKMEPDKRITAGNENIQLDKMIFENFQNIMENAQAKEINTAPTPQPPARPKSAAELAADAIKEADEMKRKGIKPQPKKSTGKKPENKIYKGIPKSPTNIRGKDVQGKSASQLAYEAQKVAQQRASEEAKIRAELEEKVAKEAMARGERDPREVAKEERSAREKAIRDMEIKRAAEKGEAPPDMEHSCANTETEEEKKARIIREQEERRRREWEEAEAEAKAAKERAAKEREARYIAEQKAKEEAAKRARELAGMSPEERKAAEERAAKRAKAKEEAQAAKEAKSTQTKLDAAKLIQERAAAKTQKAQQTAKKAVESIQQGMAAVLGGDVTEKLHITEEDLNKLVMEKYQELILAGTKPSEIDMTNLTTMVIDALSKKAQEPEVEEAEDDLDAIMEEAWGKDEDGTAEAAKAEEAKTTTESEEKAPVAKIASTTRLAREKRDKVATFDEDDLFASFKNVKSIFGDFEEFLNSSADQRYIRTGIEPVDQLLSEGLEPGVYMVRAEESIGADAFNLQAADYMASKGKDVIYLLSDSSRYGMMIKSIARLSYELRGKNKEMARSAASIMNCQSKADMANLKKEFSHYEEKIGEHLYLLEQKQMDADNIVAMIMKLSENFEKQNNKKAVVMVDDIFWMIQDEPELLEDLADLSEDLKIPILLSIGGGKINDSDFITTFIQITYAESADSNQDRDVKVENGDKLRCDLKIVRKDTGKTLNGRMSVVPKFHYFGKFN